MISGRCMDTSLHRYIKDAPRANQVFYPVGTRGYFSANTHF
jgi:hypothetical protein